MAVATESGTCFSFGHAGWGVLGHGDDRAHKHSPTVIAALREEHITEVSAGAYHSLVATREGMVYSFGFGLHGRLGHGDETRHFVPRRVQALGGVLVRGISAGESHSLALTEAGDVYSFGDGENHWLGHGDEESRWSPTLIEALSRGTRCRAA